MSGGGKASGMAVEVRDLAVNLAGSTVPVVEDVSFSIPPATVMGLVGESGSGKSTVGLALLAYARPGLEIAGEVAAEGGIDRIAIEARGADNGEARYGASARQQAHDGTHGLVRPVEIFESDDERRRGRDRGRELHHGFGPSQGALAVLHCAIRRGQLGRHRPLDDVVDRRAQSAIDRGIVGP